MAATGRQAQNAPTLMGEWLQELRLADRRDRVNGPKEHMEEQLKLLAASDPLIHALVMEVNAHLMAMGQVIKQEQAAGLIATLGLLISRIKD